MLNFPQITGIIERLVTVGVTYLVAGGKLPFLAGHESTIADWTVAVIAAAATFWGWKVNTAPSLAAATASLSTAAGADAPAPVKKVVVSADTKAATGDAPGVTTK